MEYNKKQEIGYPAGYYRIGMKWDSNGMTDDSSNKMKMKKKMKGYHDMNGYKMKGEKHYGPAGWWGIPGMYPHNY